MQEKVNYELAHIGINLEQETAKSTAELLAKLFQLNIREGKKSYFAGSMFECIRIPFRGQHGHIGIWASDLQAAIRDMESSGVSFCIDETTEYDEEGNISNIYLRDMFGGFAIHLMQK